MANLYEIYKHSVIPGLMKEFKYKSVMQVPTVQKITVNMGVGKSVINKKILERSLVDLKMITGQKPVITKARRSIASFKIRQGQEIGCKVTLRGKRMWEFLERLISIAIPRIRDFRGLSRRSFDGCGNYSIGIREQIIFPEINYDVIDGIRGMNITITTSAISNEEAYSLLVAFRFPFRK